MKKKFSNDLGYIVWTCLKLLSHYLLKGKIPQAWRLVFFSTFTVPQTQKKPVYLTLYIAQEDHQIFFFFLTAFHAFQWTLIKRNKSNIIL